MSNFGPEFNELLIEVMNERDASKRDYNRLYAEHKALMKKHSDLENRFDEKVQDAVDSAVHSKEVEMQKEIDKRDMIIAQLRSQLNNDSNNSGIPTSQTPIGKKKRVPNSRVKTGKKKGGQKGHKKHKLKAFDDNQIDSVIVHEVNPDKCDACGGNLETVGISYKDEYVLKVFVQHIRHKFITKKCTDCGKIFRAEIPDSLKEENQYGPSVQAMALILTNEGLVSMKRTKEIISGITDHEISMSEGYVAKLQKRLAGKLDDFDDELKDYIIAMSLLHWDDTVIRIGGNNAALRFYGDESVALYRAHMHKDMKSIIDDGILLSLDENTVVMHDHLTLNYNDMFAFINAECCVHLLRRLEKNNQTTGHKWSESMFGLILAAKKAKENHNTGDASKLYDDYDRIIDGGIAENANDDKNADAKHERSFLRDLRAYKDAYLLFAVRDDVPFSNNVSERSLRMEKIRQRVSGQFSNLNSAVDHAKIKSYLETGKRCGFNVCELITRALNGKYVTVKEMLEHRAKMMESGKL